MSTEARGKELPGQDLVEQGLAELSRGQETDLSLLVLIAAPRLRRLGMLVPISGPARQSSYEHQLYSRLEHRLGTGAHSYYNSLIRRIVSYARALERESSESQPEAATLNSAIDSTEGNRAN